MRITHVAGFAPIVTDVAASKAFYLGALGLPMEDTDYPMTHDLPGVRHFGLWTLADAAESCFGSREWPEGIAAPQGCLEFDVGSAEDVAAAVVELQDAGHEVLAGPRTEPWGQTVARLLSPEGLLIGVTFTPWQHEA